MKKCKINTKLKIEDFVNFHESQLLDSIEKAHIYSEEIDFGNYYIYYCILGWDSGVFKLNSSFTVMSDDFQVDDMHSKITEKLPQVVKKTAMTELQKKV